MIAIPNMEKPERCEECLFFYLDGAVTDENEWVSYSICDLLDKIIDDEDIRPDCPLIDIVECWECEFYKGDKEYCEIDHFAKEHGFCFYGKRRSE